MSSSVLRFFKRLFLGRARSLNEQNLFHKVSLIAVFAWVGLGADGLSSSCYGPEETFRALGAHPHLAIFVAVASIVTIAVICASYSQIIALFPSGGGGYLVASKLLSPAAGVVSGSALLIDYVLTIAISVASGTDALFSLLDPQWQGWKLACALGAVGTLTVINLRGVREAVVLWVPVFFVFLSTHAFAIIYGLFSQASALTNVAQQTMHEVHSVSSEIGWLGLGALLLRAYSMGAGTYTGIEAVSNGLPILREPRVRTGQRTMVYMGVSLALTAAGLLVAYLLYRVEPVAGKTLNAVLFERISSGWSAGLGSSFVWVALASEAALLMVAAQAGFLDGPRVAASMALDHWLPTRFAQLSDRLVTQNGVLLMGGAAVAMLLVTRGSVATLVVLYAINVFVTFSLSQLGMVIHWWKVRGAERTWRRKLTINGFGLALTTFILVSLATMKFNEGAWATLLATGALVAVAFAIKRHYRGVSRQLSHLDAIIAADQPRPGIQGADRTDGAASLPHVETAQLQQAHADAKTAVILVNGYNGLGLHTVLHVPRMFGSAFRNLIFLSVGTVDAGNFKGEAELKSLLEHTETEAARYVSWARSHGYGSDALTAIGHDVVNDVMKLARRAAERYPAAVFFAGQLLFTRETRLTRLLHNSTAFALQRQFFLENLPFAILPIRVGPSNGDLRSAERP